MSIVFQSFAYKHGVPKDADFIFDARILPNPYWEEGLRALTGKSESVRLWLEQIPQVIKMSEDIESFMRTWLPSIQDSQRSYVTICIGCTGGKHRSVFLAERLANSLGKDHENVLVHHREMSSWNKD